MYVILLYDIQLDEQGPKILRRVFKTCKKYLTHIQKSVFEGELTEGQVFSLRTELKKYLRSDVDSCIIFKSNNQKWLDKEFWTQIDDKTSNIL
jgi:CRISPR-associated protein Cas2